MGWRILYVDDEEDLREVAQMSLELDPDLQVRCCASGPEALEAIPEWHPDLILLDVMMPEMDGIATLRGILDAHGNSVPVVFITARASANDKAQLLHLGALDVITKPFNPMELSAQVRGYLDPAA